MHLRRSATLKYSIAGVIGAIMYCEWFMYLLQPYYWHKLKCPENDQTCVRILFVADPQIQGDEAVPPPLNYIFNYDSDRYLISTFSVVLKSFKPDVIVYLGDLMDEGYISTRIQFHKYVKRLGEIFDTDYPVRQVWLPGDNDIGGENGPIRKDKVEEFQLVFDQPPVIDFNNISFYKVNGITHQYPREEHGGNFRIVVSHYPVTARTVFGQMVNNAIRPHIYFCAHEHESIYVVQNKELSLRETFPLTYRDKILEISFGPKDDVIYEIYVPTCSYRMGTSKIGYGAAVLENGSQHMRYTVFWSPQRFPYLFFYLLVFIVYTIYIFIFCTAKVLSKSKEIKGRGDEKVPFLERI